MRNFGGGIPNSRQQPGAPFEDALAAGRNGYIGGGDDEAQRLRRSKDVTQPPTRSGAPMPQFSRFRRSRILIPLSLAAALVLGPAARAGGNAGYGCPPAFTLGAVTLAQYLNLPRHQAGLAAGAYDEDFLASAFTDHNGDGLVCVQDVAGLNGGASFWQYVYNITDDDSASR